MPLPGLGSHVIHPGWSEANRPAATDVMTATVKITRPDTFTTGVFNSSTGEQEAPEPFVVVTSLLARIDVARQVSDVNTRVVGEERVSIRRYLVQLPWDWTDISLKDVLEVLTAEDPLLIGRMFQVVDIQAMSLEWSRILRCEVYQR